MTIGAPTPPANVTASLAAELRQIARVDASLLPEERVEVSRPLPIYSLEPGQDLAAASHAGWRFIVLSSKAPFWVDLEDADVAEIIEGPAVAKLLNAAARAEGAAAVGEARILVQPLVGGGAIWIHGREDRLWTFSPSSAEDEISPSDLFADWEERRSLMTAGSTNALE